MKRLLRFLRQYKLFSLALAAVIIGLALELTKHKTAAHWLLAAVSVVAVLPLLVDMWRTIRSGAYGIDILAATAILVSVILGQYWAGIVIVLMLTGGKALEDFAQRRARGELTALLEHTPQKAVVIRKGKHLTVPVDEIRVGEKISIKAGDQVPVDAVVLEGTANFDESSLTGEGIPRYREAGDSLLSGSINLDGPVLAKATASAADSQYQQIVRLVRSASAHQARFIRLADRYSLPFTVTAYAIAATAWVLSGQAIRFLEVIVVATPCPLILAAPTALISGMARASRYGVIIKNGSALERLAGTRTVGFDKTGTLTKGELSVRSITAYGSFKKDEVLRLAASVEQNSNHVVAKAIVSDAALKHIKFLKPKHIKEVAGQGLRAQLKGEEILVGRLSMLQDGGVKLPAKLKTAAPEETAVYVAFGGKLAGVITFIDELRPEAAQTVQQLKTLGLRHILMVTGDNKAAALAVAKQLDIQEVHAETLPADKLHIVEKVKHRPVLFVGDGVNDAPVLTAADTGMALGARGSTAAVESADVVVMVDDVGRVATALHIAKRTFAIARQSIFIGIGISTALMLIFATGKFSALTGAIVQEFVDVIVIVNALRAHLIKPLLIRE